jgi:tripartite-type tricarboxylate transporter receptor subunit TctC
MVRFLIGFAAAIIAGACDVSPASAQAFPQRAVKLILPFGPAAGAATAARLIGDRLAARWGQPVVIENRPGGDGLVAINAFTAANDDHTLLFVPTSTFTAHPYTHQKLPYNAEQDLLPISAVTIIVLAISSPETLKLGSFGDFVALARAQPTKLNVAAAPGNSDFVLMGFLKSLGLQVTRVPYRDITQAPNDIAEGRIQLLMASFAVMRGLMQAGKLKVLAVTSRTRAAIAPEIPTIAEAGFPGLELEAQIGLFGARGMPVALRESIAKDIREVVAADPTIASRLQATGQVVEIRGPAEFAADIASMRQRLSEIAKTLGMKAAQ